MRIDILTLFPPMFEGPLNASILGRAREAELVEAHVHDIRDWSTDKHNKVDDRPFGGGPGMVMMCQPLHDAVLAVENMDPRPGQRILLTPQGRRTTQTTVETLATQKRLLLIAGHYEGIDERVIEALAPMELSIGDYVLSGGELPALVLVDAITRLLPGVLGHEDSAAEDSFSVIDEHGRPLLDTPHYTRPREWEGAEVPEVLLSGDHGAIARWRHEQRVIRTNERRPDLRTSPNTSPEPTSTTDI
ncbi:MAG: tRNA (guanosine(37)-N1)-methyltransferase TrmD [Phycisphaerales bacterium]|jgi:tRNA (guanine37-N1)-methyltransferase|nr:tRNA (guanosine(37)-N1)-methyltransferase TrmD [Phycisphaerales bacterium]